MLADSVWRIIRHAGMTARQILQNHTYPIPSGYPDLTVPEIALRFRTSSESILTSGTNDRRSNIRSIECRRADARVVDAIIRRPSNQSFAHGPHGRPFCPFDRAQYRTLHIDAISKRTGTLPYVTIDESPKQYLSRYLAALFSQPQVRFFTNSGCRSLRNPIERYSLVCPGPTDR
jgi:hypothetical protein